MNINMTLSENFFKQRLIGVLLLFSLLIVSSAVIASSGEGSDLPWGDMLKGLLGGLALFLFGMEQMSDALKSALGEQMKTLLGKLTSNRFSGAATGAFVTAVVQSSSVTTVLVVGFVSAGMMSMSQSIGVIMGANIGTTVTAQIVAFKVEEAALWMVAIGFITLFLAKNERVKHYGSMLMGLGLIFYGMALMGEGMHPLRSYPPFIDLMSQMSNPLLAIIVGALFTALVQSSSATTAIVITMAGQGLISLEAGIALAFGANIGTCITAQLAALGRPIEAKRAAMVHLLFNVIGVIIWLPFISMLAAWVVGISPMHPELQGTARLAAEVPRQIANAHTVFNIANTIIFIGFTTFMARLVVRLLPEEVVEEKVLIKPKYLDDALIESPSMAIQNVRFEIARMGELLEEMLNKLREGLKHRQRDKIGEVQAQDDKIDILESEILRYLGKVRVQTLSEKESREIAVAMVVADSFESVGDLMDKELSEIGYKVIDNDLYSSEAMRYIFNELGNKLTVALQQTITAVKDMDEKAANEVIKIKQEIDHLIEEALKLQSESIAEIDSEAVEIIRLEMTALENFKRMHTYLKRIAREFIPTEIRND